MKTWTKEQLIRRIYAQQKSKSKKRGHPIPRYTIEELLDWCFKQNRFYKLYNNWLKSGCKTKLIPSINRINDFEYYYFDNIELITWQENNFKGRKSSKHILSVKNLPQHFKPKPILQYSLNYIFIKEWISASEVKKELKFNQGNITQVCLGKRKSANKFIWKYKQVI